MLTSTDSVLGRIVGNAIKPRPCVTVQLNMHFVAPLRLDDFVIGRGEIIRVTRYIVFVAGRFSIGLETVATADGVWKIIADSDKPARTQDANSVV